MNKKQNNKYQLLTLIFLVVAITYIWQVYRSAQIITDNRTGKVIFNSIVAAVALFVSWFYFREAQKYSRKK